MSFPLHVYITSDSRSGSTLLDLLMGGHSDIESIGELRRLHDHYNNFLACTCDRAVSECPFWLEVNSIMSAQGDSLEETETLLPRSPSPLLDILYGLSLKLLQKSGSKLEFIAESIKIAGNNIRLIDSISQVAGKPIVVNSSKVPKIGRLMYLLRPGNTKVIFLRRDGRGIACSRSRHGGSGFSRCTLSWMLYVIKSALLWVSLPVEHRLSVRYETLCENPEETMRQICSFLGVTFDSGMTVLEKRNRHNVCGSEMRFEYGQTSILLDEQWRTRMSRKDHRNFLLLGGKVFNRVLGYR